MAVRQDIRMEKKAGKPDIEKLLLPSKYHPKGRISIDPETGRVRNPKNNVLGFQEKVIKHESGLELGRLQIEINGGHVLKEGSVWRIGLGGPSKYHYRVLDDDFRFKARGKTDRTAPELEYEEAKEYSDFLKYLKESGREQNVYTMFTGQKMNPQLKQQFTDEDALFYKWLPKGKKEVEDESKDVVETSVTPSEAPKRGRPKKDS